MGSSHLGCLGLAAILFAAGAVVPQEPEPARAPIRVACIGDSITAGARCERPAEQSYPAQLQRILGPDYEVRNFGQGGATLVRGGRPSVWERLDEALAFEPQVVVSILGTNDTVSGARGNWERRERFRDDYRELVEAFAALPTQPRIHLGSPTSMLFDLEGLAPERRSDLEQRAPRLEQLDGWVREVVEDTRALGTRWLDLSPVLDGHPERVFPGDGVHPNVAGYRALAERVAEHLRPARPRPNLVLFLVDDMGWQDTSVAFHGERTPFNELYRTPNMERLAAAGVRFTNAYAYSLCSPTRTSILGGQNAARHHVTQWTLRPGKDPSQQAGGLGSPDWALDGLQPGAPLLPGILRDRGYRTIHAGKAHWGAKGTAGEDPRALGFDVNIAGHAAGGPGSHHGDRNFSAVWRGGDPIWDVPGLERYHGREVELADALTREALAEVERAVGDGEPFFLYLAHHAVHAPLEPDRRFVEHYREAGVDEPEAVYASMIEGMDESLGRLLGKLEELGVADETLILFASDNGGLSHGPRGRTPTGSGAYTHNAPLRSGKSSAYEGGMRVPMIVSWAAPDAASELQSALPIEPGSSCAVPVHCDDFLPTLCARAGVERLARYGLTLDGEDLTPLVRGEPTLLRRNPLVWHYPHFINYGPNTVQHGYGPFSALREGRHKVLYFYDREVWELYDLEADLGEQHDLAAAQPERLGELAQLLVRRLEATGAQYPRVLETGEPRRIRPPESGR